MSEIFKSIISKNIRPVGVNKTKDKFVPREVKDQLGQEDFLKLMTVQLQNQDPLHQLIMLTSLLKWLNFYCYRDHSNG